MQSRNKTASYADDVTAVTKLKEECVKEILQIYKECSEGTGLRINTSKTEVYCVNKNAAFLTKRIAENIGTKEVSDTLVRYLGHFAQPTSKEITKQLTKVVTSSRVEIIMMSRAQKTTYFGSIANATSLLTASFRFFCYAVKSISKPADVKILKTLQKSVDSYISPVTTGDSRY